MTNDQQFRIKRKSFFQKVIDIMEIVWKYCYSYYIDFSCLPSLPAPSSSQVLLDINTVLKGEVACSEYRKGYGVKWGQVTSSTFSKGAKVRASYHRSVTCMVWQFPSIEKRDYDF